MFKFDLLPTIPGNKSFCLARALCLFYSTPLRNGATTVFLGHLKLENVVDKDREHVFEQLILGTFASRKA